MKTFYPEKSITIKASAPHPENTKYKVSIGKEEWGNACNPVVKVQMMYDGKIAGRKSPSYPAGTDDYKRVYEAIQRLASELSLALI